MTVDRNKPLFTPSLETRLIIRPVYLSWLVRGQLQPRLESFEWAEVPRNVLPLDRLRTLPEAKAEPGIYFLWRGPQLLYIGQCDSMDRRIQVHFLCRKGKRQGRYYPYTRHTAMPFPEEGLDSIEYPYIQAYRPPYNEMLERVEGAAC